MATSASSASNIDARNEKRLTAVEHELGQVKLGLTLLENRMTETSKDVSDFRQEWRDQKELERKQEEEHAKNRQIGPVQALQIAATLVALFAASMGGFFFLVKSYIDGTLTPVVTQLTERQNASAQSSVARNEIMDAMRSDQVKQSALLAEINRIALDNRIVTERHADQIRDLEIDNARRDERQKANAEIRDLQDKAERELREMTDTSLRDELRSFKARTSPP